MPGTGQMYKISFLSFSFSNAYCLITQTFLLMSEPVKAAKCCTVQFIAVVQSGTRPKATHLATSLLGMKSESRDCLLPHSVWGRLGITVASGQLAECGNQVDTATAYSAQFIPGASRSQAGAFEFEMQTSFPLLFWCNLKVRWKSGGWSESSLLAWCRPESKLPFLLWLCCCGTMGSGGRATLSLSLLSPLWKWLKRSVPLAWRAHLCILKWFFGKPERCSMTGHRHRVCSHS